MAVLDVGDPWAEYLYVRDINGNLANAGALTCVVTFPDLTTTQSATITGPSPTGTYLASLAATVPTQVGRYTWYAQATGANACSMSGAFEIRASASTAILSLDDAKGTLNWPAGDLTQDEEIRDKVDVVTALIESRIGPVLQRTITETVHGRDTIVLSRPPIISITSITPILLSGILVLNTDVVFDAKTGTVRRTNRDTFYDDYYTVVYVAGRTTINPLILEAARVMLSHLWETQRGSGTRPGQGQPEDVPATGPALTPRVIELLSDEMRVGGIA